MARIVVVGGHGKVALLAEPLLAAAGHDVDALIRDPAHADDVRAAGANPVLLSVEEASVEQLTKAFEGADVVVWSAGAGGGDPERTYAVDRDAAIRSVDAAVAAHVDRYVMVSWFGSQPDHGVPSNAPFWHYAEAKVAADQHVQDHALGWTILGPSTLTSDEPTGQIALDDPPGSLEAGSVTRGDVATTIVETIARPDLAGRFLRFNNGDVPIARALDALG